MKLQPSNSKRLILDFDLENRPLSYWYGDVTTGEITAVAWSFNDPKKIEVRALGEDDPKAMLEEFVEAYNKADIVTGHYIRMHDLPLLNAGLLELGLPPLKNKMSHDTKLDLIRLRHLPASQEALGAMLGIDSPKIGMDQKKWREANRLTAEGIALTKKRVVGDVKQHIELRTRMLELGLLRPPRMWYSVPGGSLVELDS
jgi:hypothetical protein